MAHPSIILRTDISNKDTSKQLVSAAKESLRLVYLKAELVCHSSVLTLILQAAPDQAAASQNAADQCIAVARGVFQLHTEFFELAKFFKNDPFLVQRYITW